MKSHNKKSFALAKSAVFFLATALGVISAKADNLAYATVYNGDFGTMDLTTGAFSKLDNFAVVLAGLGVANGNIYGATYNASSSAIYQVNPASGTLTRIGGDNINFTAFGSTASGGLYALGGVSSYTLYSIDPMNGNATVIGTTGLGGANATTWGQLSDGGSSLYFSDNNQIYTLNTATGAPASIGSTGSADMSALILENGAFYGSQATGGFDVDLLNPSTAAVITTTPVSGIPGGFSGFSGFAPVPEPGSVALAVVSGLGLIIYRKRNQA